MNELEIFIRDLEKSNAEIGVNRRLDELRRIVIPIEMRMGKVTEEKTKMKIYRIGEYVVIEILENQINQNALQMDKLGRITISKKITDEINWCEKDLIKIWNYKKYYILRKVKS